MDRELEAKAGARRPPRAGRLRPDLQSLPSRRSPRLPELIAAAQQSTLHVAENGRIQRTATAPASPNVQSQLSGSRIQRASSAELLDELEGDLYDEEEDEQTLDAEDASYLHDGSLPTFGDFAAPALEAHQESTEAEEARQARMERLGMRPYDGSTPVLDAVAGSRGRLQGLPAMKRPAALLPEAAAVPDPSDAAAPAVAPDAAPAEAPAPAPVPSVGDLLQAETAKLFTAKQGGPAYKADFEPIAQSIAATSGKACEWKDVKTAYNRLRKANAPKAATLPSREVTRSTLTTVLSGGDSGGQRYSPTKKSGGLEYHVSVEFSPISDKPSERGSCPVRIKRMHVSFETEGNTDERSKDRYWYHWSGQSKKFSFESRAGRHHADMRAVADAAVRGILPRLNCPDL